MKKNLLWVILLSLFLGLVPGQAQTVSTGFDMNAAPLWARDLRRGEIVAFGSFPFAFFFTNMIYDTYRCSTHDWDRRYAPWPLKSAGSVDLTRKEQLRNLGIAAGSSVVIAVVDHLIVRYQRNKREKEIRSMTSTPIVIRRPLESSPEYSQEIYDETPLETTGSFAEEAADSGFEGDSP